MPTVATLALVLLVAVAPSSCSGPSSEASQTSRASAGGQSPASAIASASHENDALLDGWMAYRAGNDDEAAAGFRQALEADPSLADALYGLALIDQRHARFDQAVDELRRASGADPSSSVYLAALGEACIRAGRLQEARAALGGLRRLALTHDVVPAQIRIFAGDLQRAEQLAAARHDSSSAVQGAPARGRAQ